MKGRIALLILLVALMLASASGVSLRKHYWGGRGGAGGANAGGAGGSGGGGGGRDDWYGDRPRGKGA